MGKYRYPETRREEVVEELHGIRVRDPYRWLERDTQEVRYWENRQNALTNEVLNSWTERKRLEHTIRSIMLRGMPTGSHGDSGSISDWAEVDNTLAPKPPCFCKRFIFHVASLPPLQRPVLFATDRSTWDQRVLVNPNEMGEESALDWYYPSPDGSFVAYGISRDGNEQSTLHVVETGTGKVLPEEIPFTSFARVNWLPDSSGFYYSGGKATDFEDAEKWLFYHGLGDTHINQPEPIRSNDPYVSPVVSSDGKYIVANFSWEKPCAAYYKDRLGDDVWRPFLLDIRGESYGRFIGDKFLALTTYGAPRGRIVLIPMETVHDESTWKEVVPESEAVLRHFAVVGESLLISELCHACSRLRVVSLQDSLQRVLELPGMGLIQHPGAPDNCPFSIDGDEVYFCYETFTEPARLYRYDFKTHALESLGQKPRIDLSHISVSQVHYSSKDGTRIPMFLVHRKGLDLHVPHEILLYGYGGWNALPAPVYIAGGDCLFLPFVEAGGICAFPSLRGGCEFGRNWWMNGRREKKQNTFDDVCSAAEYLIDNGWTSPRQMAIWGASNGGLLVAAAITKRPDLFRVAVSKVPITDMIRALDDPYLSSYTVEYGDPNDAEMLPVLLSYSPVHNVKEGASYPAVLILCGKSDIRCQPWNGSKLAALLQHATASDEPVLLKIGRGGHGPGLSFDDLVERKTDALGFIMQCLGMRPPEISDE